MSQHEHLIQHLKGHVRKLCCTAGEHKFSYLILMIRTTYVSKDVKMHILLLDLRLHCSVKLTEEESTV